MSWLKSARMADGAVVDVEIADGRVSRVVPAASAQAGGAGTDLAGYLLLPSFVEPHAHLDKALLGGHATVSAVADAMTRAEIAGRAERALRIYLAHGTTAIRTHVNVGGGAGLRGLEALVGLREKWRGIIDLQVVALVGPPFDGQGGQDLRRALKEGADVAGGAPHLDPQPDRAVRICLDIAGDAGTPVDLHADETLNPNMLTLATMADLVAETRFPFRVTASHCVSLAVQPRAVQQSVSEQVARAGIAVVALPHTNLFRQGRDLPVRTPRGLTAIRALRAAGVTLAAGGDNLRDPVNPVGRGDALEVAALMVTAGHLEPGEAIGSVTDAARTALGLPPVQVGPGCPADLVAIRAADAHEAVGAASPDRVAWRSGQVVARTTICSEISEPARDAPRLSAAGA
ncbi:MAG TPA: amidohydrolase family protein [Trebonia sp.]|jgi:cytosine deaminase|nr:amidohydrolase family protein [Trebonia sp.]